MGVSSSSSSEEREGVGWRCCFDGWGRWVVFLGVGFRMALIFRPEEGWRKSSSSLESRSAFARKNFLLFLGLNSSSSSLLREEIPRVRT